MTMALVPPGFVGTSPLLAIWRPNNILFTRLYVSPDGRLITLSRDGFPVPASAQSDLRPRPPPEDSVARAQCPRGQCEAGRDNASPAMGSVVMDGGMQRRPG
jgi:hypothetical protein